MFLQPLSHTTVDRILRTNHKRKVQSRLIFYISARLQCYFEHSAAAEISGADVCERFEIFFKVLMSVTRKLVATIVTGKISHWRIQNLSMTIVTHNIHTTKTVSNILLTVTMVLYRK